MAEIIVAPSAGFCFGVQRSVSAAQKLLAENKSCASYGELIHNDDVIAALEEQGLKVISSAEEARPGESVIIRAHGIPKNEYDALAATGASIEDTTCPKVKSIHKIVSNAAAEGRTVIIIGMKNHPEIKGICGWCGEHYVAENAAELEKIFESNPSLRDKAITAVVQTTQTRANFDECSEIIKKWCTNPKIFDTICLATFTRQSEASDLSAECDAMVVIGAKHSANSVHLAEICREHCENVQFIANAGELDMSRLSGAPKIGLTAGASTPEWIIKEVRNKMSDEVKAVESAAEEQSFDEMLEETLKPIYNGEKVTGIVAGISGTEVSVDLGTKYSGFIPTTEWTEAGVKVEDAIKVGDEIEAIVVRVNDVEGTAMLSKKRLDATKFWDSIEQAADDGTVVEGTVVEENKGGVVVNVKGVRVFVPASQSDLPRDAELSQLLKKDVKLKITEVNKARKRVVGSIRRAAQAERKALSEAIWNDIEIGKKYVGKVKSLTSYGAFVDIGGIDGMVHVSELGWGRIHHPSEVVNPGDEVEVYVINFDKDAKKISLGYKDPDGDPWKKFTSEYAVGDTVTAKIVKLMPFGAFAQIIDGVDGLIHISQIADHRIAKPDDVLKAGDEVQVKITAIDDEKQKISLSIRALLQPEETAPEAEAAPAEAEEAPAEAEAAPAEE